MLKMNHQFPNHPFEIGIFHTKNIHFWVPPFWETPNSSVLIGWLVPPLPPLPACHSLRSCCWSLLGCDGDGRCWAKGY